MEPNPYKIIFDIIFACTGLIGSMMVLGISLFLTFDGSWVEDLWGNMRYTGLNNFLIFFVVIYLIGIILILIHAKSRKTPFH